MPKLIRIELAKRGVACTAELLEKQAPRTCAAVWDALADGPMGGDAQHAKYARNEVYTIVRRFGPRIGQENPTVTPIPGDVCYFDFHGGMLDAAFKDDQGIDADAGGIDLAIFYGRNNLLINGDVGWVPGNVWAQITEGLDAIATACHDVWRSGSVGERLVYSRLEGLMPAELSVGHGLADAPEDAPGIGMVTPFDFALDRELWRWAPDDTSLYLTRMPYLTTPMTVEMAVAIADTGPVRQATRDVLTPRPGVVSYACTSGSFVGGAAAEYLLHRTILDAGAPRASTTSGALVEALAVLGVERLAIATPYIAEVTERLVGFLAEHHVETVASEGLGLIGNIWRTTYAQVVDIVRQVDRPDAQALFISCTNLPTYDVIEPLEQALGKPVLTANQVTMWDACRKIDRAAVGGGRLLGAWRPGDPQTCLPEESVGLSTI